MFYNWPEILHSGGYLHDGGLTSLLTFHSIIIIPHYHHHTHLAGARGLAVLHVGLGRQVPVTKNILNAVQNINWDMETNAMCCVTPAILVSLFTSLSNQKSIKINLNFRVRSIFSESLTCTEAQSRLASLLWALGHSEKFIFVITLRVFLLQLK